MRQIERSVTTLNVEDEKSLQIYDGENRGGTRSTLLRICENELRPPQKAAATSLRVEHMFSLKDKVALVTGASQGIGRETASGTRRSRR